jgi:mannan endo-1,4-beta-mannosidase
MNRTSNSNRLSRFAIASLMLIGLLATAQIPARGQVNPNATAETKKLYKWIQSLRNRSTNKVIVGQEIRNADRFPRWEPSNVADTTFYSYGVSELQQNTGHWVGLIGHEYNGLSPYDSTNPDYPGGDTSARTDLINYWNSGGLVTVNWNFANPFNGGWYGDLNNVDLQQLLPNAQGVRLAAWQQQLDNTAAELKKYQDAGVVVIWRPFQEMNGNWFWWGKVPSNPTAFKAVWQDMYNYFTQVKKLDNLLWVYSPAGTTGAQASDYTSFYPGDNYVDIVGPTIYGDNSQKTDFNWIGDYSWFKDNGKPIFLGEFGRQISDPPSDVTNDYDLRRLVTGLQTNYPEVVGVQYWSSWKYPSGVYHRQAIRDNLYAKELLSDPRIITREETKNFFVNPGFQHSVASSDTSNSTQTPSGWSEYGGDGYDVNASFAQKTTNSWEPSDMWHGTHYSSTNFKAFTYQWVSGLDDNATYTLTAKVRRSSGFNSAYIEVVTYKNTGPVTLRVNVPADLTQPWNTVTIPNIQSAGGGVQVNIISDGLANNWLNFDDIKLVE